tara:strand:+ start:15960 stop:17045 length:1086 start_codon:yes stop_codon:yes gene_type:complete
MNYFESVKDIFNFENYKISQKEKVELLMPYFYFLNNHHIQNCKDYKNIINKLYPEFDKDELKIKNIPFIPVQLFKDFELLSIKKKEIFKTMLSSGTSGGNLSKIFLGKEDSRLQTKVLSHILSSFLGKKRVPMLIIDSPKTIKDRNHFSVRRAATLGFSIYAKNIFYALDDNFSIDWNSIEKFSEISKNQNSMVFGFTNIVWTNFIESLLANGKEINLEGSLLVHGGGWKKLESKNISNKEFKNKLNKLTNISKVVNYYGMVEQTGSIFMECEKGFFHCSNFSDVIIRNFNDFKINKFNEKGLIQVLSILPYSYPGHSLITEDIGIIHGEDDCSCGRLGKYFSVLGRIPKAEVRGCSDAYL